MAGIASGGFDSGSAFGGSGVGGAGGAGWSIAILGSKSWATTKNIFIWSNPSQGGVLVDCRVDRQHGDSINSEGFGRIAGGCKPTVLAIGNGNCSP